MFYIMYQLDTLHSMITLLQ